jgi:hypothetical protein
LKVIGNADAPDQHKGHLQDIIKAMHRQQRNTGPIDRFCQVYVGESENVSLRLTQHWLLKSGTKVGEPMMRMLQNIKEEVGASCMVYQTAGLPEILTLIALSKSVANHEASTKAAVGILEVARTLLKRSGAAALQGQEGVIFKALNLDLSSKLISDPFEIAVLATGIDHQIEAVIVGTPGHQVINDPALMVQEQAVAQLSRLQADEIAGRDLFEGCQGRNAAQARLPHMGHIKQPCLLASPKMLGQDTVLVLHRHLVPGKGHHPRAKGEMSIIERRALKGWIGHWDSETQTGRQAKGDLSPQWPAPPLS